MKARRPAARYLLLFALLVGQWLYVSHAHDYAVFEGDQQCQLCLRGIQYDAFLPSTAHKTLAVTSHIFHNFASPNYRPTSQTRFHDSRAPPRS